MMAHILRNQQDANGRALAALRAMLDRNQQQQEAVARMAAKPEAAEFDRKLEALIVAAWKGEDVSAQRAAVHRMFCARIAKDPELVGCLAVVTGTVVDLGVRRG